MYTEYVFNNKKYDVASREIKATLFDIVSSEERRIGKLREKAFGGDLPEEQAAKLQALYIQEDELLRKLLDSSKEVCDTLQKVDSCSRTLKQIENENEAQIVANIHGEDKQEEASKKQDEVVEVIDEGDALAAQEAAMNNSVIPVAPEQKEVVEEIVEEGKESSSEEAKDEVNGENSILDEAASQPLIPIEAESSNGEDSNQSDEVQEQGDAKDLGDVSQDQEDMKSEDNTSQEQVNPNNQGEEVLQDTLQEQVDTVPLIVESYPDGEDATNNTVENEPATQDVAVMTPTENPIPETVIEGNVLDPVMESAEQNEVGMPIIEENPSEQVGQNGVVTAGITFKKRGTDPAKVIMINKDQAAKLRGSLPTQEALLSASGLFKQEDSLETQLMNNGLLEGDVTTKQAQIEKMMEQANALYTSGKVEEAQAMYDQISALNKELQAESAGMTI